MGEMDVLGMAPIGRGRNSSTKGVSDWTLPLLLFWSFLSPAPLHQCPVRLQPLLVWMGGLLLHLLDLEGGGLFCRGLFFF